MCTCWMTWSNQRETGADADPDFRKALHHRWMELRNQRHRKTTSTATSGGESSAAGADSGWN